MNKEDLYFIETWPDVQYLMECEGFDENCFLINDEIGYEEFGPAAYFVNLKWYENIVNHLRNVGV